MRYYVKKAVLNSDGQQNLPYQHDEKSPQTQTTPRHMTLEI
jgi:hypothetical protein